MVLKRCLSLLALLAVLLSSCETTAPQPAAWSPLNTVSATQAGDLPTPLAANSALATETESPQIDLQGLPDLPADVNPLTGLRVADPTRLERRPLMVKVSNYPRTGRPHSGLSFADIVFEYYIGYGYNRFLAIYYGQDADMVGPVRSGRLVDAQLAEMYQGLLFYGNADDQTDKVLLQELGARALAEKYIPTPPKYRIKGDPIETTLFVNTRELTEYVKKEVNVSDKRRDLRGMIFSDQIHPENEPGDFLAVQFSRQARGEWRYNSKTGLYERWIESGANENTIDMIPMVDRLTNKQITFDNLILVYATYTQFNPTLHNIALFDQNVGKRAVFFRDGVKIEGTWKTASNGRPIQFLNNWGLPMHLKPGNTWIVLTGDTSTLKTINPGQWELRFDIP